MRNVSERLEYLRTTGKLSFSELDALAGLATGHTAQIAKGVKGNPTVSTLRSIARVFGWREGDGGPVSLDWLVGGVGEQPVAEKILDAVKASRSRRSPD